MAAAKYRRGFKSEAENIALATRQELGLAPIAQLDCLTLADNLDIPVVSLTDMLADGARPRSVACLQEDAARFSAVTVCAGTRRIIVYNPAHSAGRRANSLAHELSHIILEHPAGPAIGSGGCREWDERCESEADWLAGVLLIPREGALLFWRENPSMDEGAAHFGVSLPLFRQRVNQTGILRQLAGRR